MLEFTKSQDSFNSNRLRRIDSLRSKVAAGWFSKTLVEDIYNRCKSMGFVCIVKKENNNNQGPTQEQAENQPQRNNNEEINAENTNEEIKEENKENKPNPKGVIVLGVYMHCQGCADKIVKYLRGFDGVEQIETDMKNHIVTVKGKKTDPKKILERLPKKSNKHVQPKEVEVVLKIYMHCEGCSEDIKYRIYKMQGIFSA
ncbi:Heavy metal-associated isoprenylated plant protein 8 [Camellia lanceoleosa]|uniref:Heavy metal-associated isoprenylated plant protein 8 n=1 Tax=Camellia lanceoleosa TaxID=1840588 RepID=A0ACC0HZ42_9ERIC|nr:Heavy metal-associated isoprenylated plant protein 8 [Camellia lanceoleosa]